MIARLFTLALGITTALWAVGYVGHVPLIQAPGPVIQVGFLLCFLLGGFLCARWIGRGKAPLICGALTGVFNLLVLGSVITKQGAEAGQNALEPSALLWVPGSILLSAVLTFVGSLFGPKEATEKPTSVWLFRMGLVSLLAAGLVLIAGGLVTGSEAGLAVEDWPTSFGSNMFLLPLSKMTGAIYLEHAHRLLGVLAGLTMLTLAVCVLRGEPRKGIRRFALALLALVIVQGLLGGARVRLARPDAGGVAHLAVEHETTLSVTLRIVHGVTAQIFVAGLALLVALLSKAWLAESKQTNRRPADTGLLRVTAVALLLQLVLGAVVRHLGAVDQELRERVLMAHFAFAAVVAVLVFTCGTRLWNRDGHLPVTNRIGAGLTGLMATQLVLGVTALFATAEGGISLGLSATLTTAHQATGAVIFGLCVAALPFASLHREGPGQEQGKSGTDDADLRWESAPDVQASQSG